MLRLESRTSRTSAPKFKCSKGLVHVISRVGRGIRRRFHCRIVGTMPEVRNHSKSQRRRAWVLPLRKCSFCA
ncbi:hypothetical protein Y032_0256g359 [Ancylostoma ceylanicum]|uniref:Uncharacterized protein n=1 Tax=Ancylostoma ceylanicum TaxID=53326 RepID=A0A016SBV0_9BILA|nr:hypothetical protein Y032_0256g359 [Ancylostoma ceylanicum]